MPRCGASLPCPYGLRQCCGGHSGPRGQVTHLLPDEERTQVVLTFLPKPTQELGGGRPVYTELAAPQPPGVVPEPRCSRPRLMLCGYAHPQGQYQPWPVALASGMTPRCGRFVEAGPPSALSPSRSRKILQEQEQGPAERPPPAPGCSPLCRRGPFIPASAAAMAPDGARRTRGALRCYKSMG